MKPFAPLRVVVKRLVAVDLPDRGSNQHEINAGTELQKAFEGRPLRGPIAWTLFTDEPEPQRDEGDFNLYDSRAKSAYRTGRSEWRLYYTGDFLSRAEPGDVLFLALMPEGDVRGIVTASGSAAMRAAAAVLPIPDHHRFELLGGNALADAEANILGRRVLEELEVEPPPPPQGREIEDLALRLIDDAGREKREFPRTLAMAETARHGVVYDPGRPDEALVTWLAREEALFAAVERILLSDTIAHGFNSVDEFATAALSMLNRRKARMGHSLQNHLAEILRRQGLRFSAQGRTEGRNQPDFLLPGEAEYHDRNVDPSRLVMLAAKSTCKDRWRQILTEADRIPIKHLCTLDPAVSLAQLREMQSRGVVLVIPAPLQKPYGGLKGGPDILTVQEFLDVVRHRTG